MTHRATPTLTWEENEKGTLIGTAHLDDGTVVQYTCRNNGDDDNPDWTHLRIVCRPLKEEDARFSGDVAVETEFTIKGSEDAQTRMRSVYLCMTDLRELVKGL